jgi:glycosyltransferase involved in cell wall biosynthesis
VHRGSHVRPCHKEVFELRALEGSLYSAAGALQREPITGSPRRVDFATVTLSVSIVTPSLNQATFVQEAIDSVLTQCVPGLEYLVIDGASDDETVAVLRAYSQRVRWISEEDRGQAHAVNKGIAATSGDVIGWLNSDDIYTPGSIRAALEYLERHPDVDVVYGQAEHIDTLARPLQRYPTEPWNLTRLLQVCYICQPAVFFRRRVVDRFGLLDERLHYCLDYEYWLRLGLGRARFALIDRIQAGSRQYAETKTAQSRLATYEETLTMLSKKVGRVPEAWIFNYAHVLVEEQAVSRQQPVRFAGAILAATWRASMRWNGNVSPQLLRLVGRWVGRHSVARLRRPSN